MLNGGLYHLRERRAKAVMDLGAPTAARHAPGCASAASGGCKIVDRAPRASLVLP